MRNNKSSLPGLSGIGSFILHDIILYIQQRCCGSGKLTSHDLPGHSEIHQGLGPYGPGCSYATAANRGLNFMTLAGDLQFYEALLNPSAQRSQVRDGSFYIKVAAEVTRRRLTKT